MKYRAVLFDLYKGVTKDVYWDGPDYVSLIDSLETELACGADFTEIDEQHLKISGIFVFMRYTLTCDPPNQRLAWRIKHDDPGATTYLGNALFFAPEAVADYSGWVEGDCPMSSAEIASKIMLVKYSEDFSEVQMLGAPIAVDDQ